MTRSAAVSLLAASVATGCFQPYEDLPKLDFSEMSFDADGVSSDTAVVQAFDLAEHTCPDGEPARLYAVYDVNTPPGAPVAVVLHSGAFDWILSFDEGEDSLDGRHYRIESRLERPWALAKVWETLGMLPTPVDAGEDNAGTLPVALLEAGFLQLYPANCWGDLWHADVEVQPNDVEAEGFERDGLGLAATTARIVTEPGFASTIGVNIPVEIDPAQLFIVGLGDGGRGVPDLLDHPVMQGASVAGIAVDSTPDLASAYVADPATWSTEISGMATIYGEGFAEDPDAGSLAQRLELEQLPAPIALVWSPLDHSVPQASVAPLASAVLAGANENLVVEVETPGHVHANSDALLAEGLAAWMTTGEFPAAR